MLRVRFGLFAKPASNGLFASSNTPTFLPRPSLTTFFVVFTSFLPHNLRDSTYEPIKVDANAHMLT